MLVSTAVSAAVPSFVAAIVLILLFSVKLGWFPALGNGTSFWSNVQHFTLPAVALAISSLAIVARVTGQRCARKPIASMCRQRSAAASPAGS